MVSTRRTSLRLQEKVASAPSSPVAENTTPTRARKTAASNSATKKSPRTDSASKAKTPPKRGSGRKAAAAAQIASAAEQTQSGDDAVATATSSSEPSTVDTVAKELFDDNSADSASDHGSSTAEPRSGETTESDDASVDQAKPAAVETPVASAAAAPVATPARAAAAVVTTTASNDDANDDEEEEELLLMADSDDEDDEQTGAAGDDDNVNDEQEEDDDEDISAYAMMAASGLNLSTSKPALTGAAATTATPLLRTKLVPDALDSGASQHATYFAFAGRAAGATLLADKRAQEEQATLASTQRVSGLASRQRAEHTNTKSAGRKWFGMASEELTADARRDFALLRMRNYLDPKKFYKTSDHHKKLPKHFQLGVVIEGAHEFKSARLTKKQRQQTFTDEIMADTAVQAYTKRVFGQVQAARSGQGKKKKARTGGRQ